MSRPIFTTHWSNGSESFTSVAPGPATLKLIKQLARDGIKAKTRQIGERKGGGGTYKKPDGTFGWELATVLRQPRTK